MIDTGDIDVFLGLDVGKGEHHATAVTPAGKKAFGKRLPNTGPKLRELFAKLQAKHGTVLVAVAGEAPNVSGRCRHAHPLVSTDRREHGTLVTRSGPAALRTGVERRQQRCDQPRCPVW